MLNKYLPYVYLFKFPKIKLGQFWQNFLNSPIDSINGEVFKTSSLYHDYEDILTMRPSRKWAKSYAILLMSLKKLFTFEL
ncbi:MAG: hypothetical protein BWX51_01645 [Bacteroidetes bacterium ADurb.Bin012]|jgi:hypothetical protein|nr:MAG: hypothetical protein BWX51_01645 [Bacteroidetes bacterium ADurb.Bin012]